MASKKSSGKAKGRAAPKNKATEDKKQQGAEKALTEDNNLANEQLATLPPEKEIPAAEEKKIEKPREEARELAKEPAPAPKKEEPENSKVEEAMEAKKEPMAQTTPEKASGKISPRLPGGISPRPLFDGNPYLPQIATVAEVVRETHNIKTLRLVLDDKKAMADFVFQPGQVGQISVFGAGEATFVINSPPSQKEYLQFSVMRAGEVTDAIHRLSAGDKVGLRAPLGNFFPCNDWKGKNVFFVGGGIGMAPIRTIMLHLLENKADYGKISLLYGARSPKDMAFSYELDDWKNNPDLDCTLCIDSPHDDWGHKVGLIPKVLEELSPSPDNAVAVLCGPPIMIKFTLESLKKLGFEPQNIVTTLEKRMKCGIGICGRCNIGDRFVCVDGPVFTLKELDGLPPDL